MGLNTENASDVVGKPGTGIIAESHKVEVLIGTFVRSVGRDVKQGVTALISEADYRFLKPYGYVKDAHPDAEVDVAPVSDNTPAVETAPATDAPETTTEDDTSDNTDAETEVEDSTDTAPKAEGKRKS